jgi:nucleotide-binding universal stress UspA family protein
MRIERVYYPVDFSETVEVGLSLARSIATEYGAELLLHHVLNFPYPQMDRITPSFDLETYYRDMETEATASMEAMVTEETRRYAPTRVLVTRGTPATEILDTARAENVDLIVIPTHGRKGLQHVLFGSTAEKVLRLAPVPVLTVHPGQPPQPFRPDRIVVATDFSPSADLALAEALALAKRYDARLTVVHVATFWDSDPANPAWRFPALPEDHRQTILDVASERLARQARRADLQIDTRLLRGIDPASQIVREATDEIDADLLVIGTHGHTGLAHVLLGSVAERIVRTAEIPVLTIRAPRD